MDWRVQRGKKVGEREGKGERPRKFPQLCVIRAVPCSNAPVCFASSPAMCRAALRLRSPLVSVEEAVAAAVWARADVEDVEVAEEEPPWLHLLAELAVSLRALVQHARSVGLDGDEAEEAEDAAAAPVGDTELAHIRALQFRQGAGSALATLLCDAGHTSALITAHAVPERRVRPRLA